MKKSFGRTRKKDQFKVRGWIGMSNHPGYVNIKMVDNSRYKIGKDDLKAVVFHDSDWASILTTGNSPRRIGKVFHTASGRSFTFSVYGYELYASKTYLQNLLNGKADFVCLSSRVMG